MEHEQIRVKKLKLLITSEMRCGSRWIHYLLTELCSIRTSKEMDVTDLDNRTNIMRSQWKSGRTVKLHHANPDEIFSKLKPHDYKVLAIVRNPRDRIVSKTFHQRYKPPGFGNEVIKRAKTDREAVRVTFNLDIEKDWNEKQFGLMIPGLSTKCYKDIHKYSGKYLWTSYKWLKEDIFGEIKKILKFLGIKRSDDYIRKVIDKNSFKQKSGREIGNENKRDEWRRKGIQGDFVNWFDEDMIKESQDITNRYLGLITDEE